MKYPVFQPSGTVVGTGVKKIPRFSDRTVVAEIPPGFFPLCVLEFYLCVYEICDHIGRLLNDLSASFL